MCDGRTGDGVCMGAMAGGEAWVCRNGGVRRTDCLPAYCAIASFDESVRTACSPFMC